MLHLVVRSEGNGFFIQNHGRGFPLSDSGNPLPIPIAQDKGHYLAQRIAIGE